MGLEEQELREWVQRVAHGKASRRHFISSSGRPLPSGIRAL